MAAAGQARSAYDPANAPLLSTPGESQSLKPSRLTRESANLDLLRSTAVGLVYVFHLLLATGAHPANNLGRFGVLLFFVHTSLVLMMSLERLQRRGERLFAAFYLRRIFRIYPLSLLCVLIIFALHLPRAPWWPQLADIGAGTLAANLTLTMNLFYKDPLTSVLWSLPYEVQMYVALPVLYLAGRRYGARGIAVLWVAAVGLALVQPHISGRLDIAQYGPCFLGGVLAYFLGFASTRGKLPSVAWPVFIAAVTIAYCKAPAERPASWIACLLLGAAAPLFREVSLVSVNRITSTVAKYSYGVYLTHLQIFWFCRSGWVTSISAVQWTLLVVFSILVPVVLYHLVEAPLIRFGMKLGDRLSPA